LTTSPLDILKKYWNFSTFREPQTEIINSVLEGNDALALMPTGGGKSICYQVPAMVKDGICLVISPLIALMNDQVNQLKNKGIKAIALTGNLTLNDTADIFDNCEFGGYKFLYLSPERLQNYWVLERIKNLNINLIAIDEAHCISQWGHDFRPSYLQINVLKEIFPTVPFLAVTASATAQVQADILKQLKLKNPKIFTTSFERKNIAYKVISTETPLYFLKNNLKNDSSISIIYVRNRKACVEISTNLNEYGISATYFHGGLTYAEKEKNMNLWMTEKVQTIVATNAFGMGIDKPNVRKVIHTQMPENIENYYQEAGRAGRDGEWAEAILVLNPSETDSYTHLFFKTIPTVADTKLIYRKLCSYFQVGYGEQPSESFPFSIQKFCQVYDFDILKTLNVLQFLDRQSILSFEISTSEKYWLQFTAESSEVIAYYEKNIEDEAIISAILRTYYGIFDESVSINPYKIAEQTKLTYTNIINCLERLQKRGLAAFKNYHNDSLVTFTEMREDDRTINRVSRNLEQQTDLKKEQLKAILQYINDDSGCKSAYIQTYFDEKKHKKCGICSYCLNNEKPTIKIDKIAYKILEFLSNNPSSVAEIEQYLKLKPAEVLTAVEILLEHQKIRLLAGNKLEIIN